MKLFNFQDLPARTAADHEPEVFIKGKWEPYYDLDSWYRNACEIQRPAFDALMAEASAAGTPT